MDTYDKICTIDALYRAYRRARRGKRRKMARFEYQEQLGLSLIRQELIDETYTPGPLKLFYVYEPKKRDVLAPTVKDKIVLHALCDEYLYDTVTRSFIAANTASQTGKGPAAARDLLHRQLHNYWCKYGSTGYVLRCDVRKFFASIPHGKIKELCTKKIKDERILGLVNKIIDCADGLPLGLQSSQLFALMILDGLDHRIKERWRVKYYGRYMDDFYLLDPEKERLKTMLADIREYIGKMGLELNEKTTIFPIAQGVPFLGFHAYLREDGHVYSRVNRQKVEQTRRRLKKFKIMYKEGRISAQKIAASYQGSRNYISQGDTGAIIAKLDALFLDIFKEDKNLNGLDIKQILRHADTHSGQ